MLPQARKGEKEKETGERSKQMTLSADEVLYSTSMNILSKKLPLRFDDLSIFRRGLYFRSDKVLSSVPCNAGNTS
jgi:hypothetical protein